MWMESRAIAGSSACMMHNPFQLETLETLENLKGIWACYKKLQAVTFPEVTGLGFS